MNIYLRTIVKGYLLVKTMYVLYAAMDTFPVLTSSVQTEAESGAPRRVPLRRRLHGKPLPLESTRERILTAAAQLFAEYGFASTSMPAIAELSGITAGAIYRHFKSKAELLLEVVKRALEALPLSLLSFERSSSEEDVTLLPDLAARFTDPALTLLRQLSVEVHAAARRDPEVNKLLSAYNEAAMQRIRALLEVKPQVGPRRAPPNPEFTARALMVFLMGLNHMDTLHPQLVGDQAWREFVAAHVATLLGLKAQIERSSPAQGRAPARGAGSGQKRA
jgi:AcrR family transcriptional regulator